MKNYSHYLTILLFLGFTISCNKTYDEPPVVEIPEGTIISISDLKDMFTGSPITLDSNYSIYGNITCEETNGNFYKEAYIQDLSGAIKLKLDASGGLYIGDSIRVSLNGVTMSEYGDLIQLDNISVDEQIVKIATDRFVTPYTTSINNLNIEDDQSRLIKLDSVEFQSTNVTYADAINLATGERYLNDCDGNSILVRTSGYANFADDTVASGKGSIIGIFTRYGATKQFIIRDITEVNMEGDRCGGSSGGGGGGSGNYILNKDFNDGSVTSGGWGSFWSGTTTTENWGEWGIFGGDVAAASNFDINTFTNYACESWLVSPSFDLTGTSSPYLVFDNVTRYNGPGLELYISSNYDGSSDPSQQGTWLNITSYVPNWDTDSGDWSFVSSGNIDLTPFISSNLNIAFKYIGTNADGATWELDNIIVND
tara:strand:- start:2452 stop:3726 length:1275 start_codon:yes stop_codon:yes gene_type:complete